MVDDKCRAILARHAEGQCLREISRSVGIETAAAIVEPFGDGNASPSW
ncbi:hypothetical protein [Nocardia carnea]|nr:hypothetical protein [Nocardia carnea]